MNKINLYHLSIKLICFFIVSFYSIGYSQNNKIETTIFNSLHVRTPNKVMIKKVVELSSKHSQLFFSDKNMVELDSFMMVQIMNFPDETIKPLSILYKSASTKNESIKSRLELLIAMNYFMLSDSKNAFLYIKKADMHSKSVKNENLRWRILIAEGNFNGAICDFYTSTHNYLEALEFCKNDKSAIAKTYHNIASNYMSLEKFSTAKKYSLGSIELSPEFRIDFYNQIATIYSSLNILDSAQFYYKKILAKGTDELSLYDLAHFNKGYSTLLIKRKKYDQALGILKQNEKLCEENNLSQWSSSTFNSLGEVYYFKNNLKLAENYLLKSLDSLNFPVGFDTGSNACYLLSHIYEKQGKYKDALFYYQQYNEYSNFIKSEKIQKELLNLESKYKSKLQQENIRNLQKDKQILNRDKYLDQLKLEKSKNFIIYLAALSILLFCLGIASILFYRQRKAKTEAQIKLIQKRKELDKLHAILSGQEMERERISLELHDSVGSDLLVLAMNSKEKEEITRIYNEVRTLSHQLNIPVLDANTPISKWSENLVKGIFSESDINVFFNWHPKEINLYLEKNGQQNLYRIIQESLINILKHAKAKNVEVQFFIENETMLLSIIDDGIGFDQNLLKKGIGHKNMVLRTKSLDGKYTINSKLNSGTTLEFEFPLSVFTTDI